MQIAIKVTDKISKTIIKIQSNKRHYNNYELLLIVQGSRMCINTMYSKNVRKLLFHSRHTTYIILYVHSVLESKKK